MRMICKLAAVAAFVSMPVTAMAATVTQLFTSSAAGGIAGAQGDIWTTPDGFITIESTGGEVYFGSSRVGVAKPGDVVQRHSTLNINEALKFTFAAPVTDVTLARSGGLFPVGLTSYNGTDVVYSNVWNWQLNSQQMPVGTVLNGPENDPITSFLLEGIFGTGSGITSITYTTVDAPPPSAVPLPAAGMLLAGGLAAMAGLRRRASRKA